MLKRIVLKPQQQKQLIKKTAKEEYYLLNSLI